MWIFYSSLIQKPLDHSKIICLDVFFMVEKIVTDDGFIEEIKKITPIELVFVKQEALKELHDCYSVICKSDTDEDIKRYLANYTAIRLVGWIENYFKNSVIWLIDYYNLTYDEFKIEFNLLDLKTIQSTQDFTAGKIVSRKLNFQNLGKIMGAMNSILKINDFSDRLEKQGVNLGRIQQILDARHKIVHDFQSSGWDHNACLEAKQDVMRFIFSSNSIVTSRIEEIESKK